MNNIKGFLTKVSERRNNFALVGSIVTLIAMFMPYAKVSVWGFSQSVSYISTEDGKIVLPLLIVASIAYYLKRNGIGCLTSGIILIIVLIDFGGINDAVSESFGMASAGIGCYLLILGALIMVAAPFVGHKVEEAVYEKLNNN